MEVVQLIEDIIRLLRNEVDGWATVDGIAQVHPSHPPLDLDRSNYPRATVDVISTETVTGDIEHKQYVEEASVDITVYAVDAEEMNRLVGDARQAILENHDSGQYLADWSFVGPGVLSPVLEEGGDKHLTRYNRTSEMSFRTITKE